MIVLSFLLVVIAAVTLLVGLFQDTLTWIWASIASCVLAMIALGVGVLQRRSGRGEAEEAPSSYGPGAISSLIPGEESEEEEAKEPEPADVSVVPKRTVWDAEGEMSQAEVEEAADQAVAQAEAKTAAARESAEAEEEPAASEKTAKKTTKKTTKKAAKKTAKKTAKKAAKDKTTGKAAREKLDEIKGLGPAKQKALLDEFGSLEGIRDADLEELQDVKGIGTATAAAIKSHLS